MKNVVLFKVLSIVALSGAICGCNTLPVLDKKQEVSKSQVQDSGASIIQTFLGGQVQEINVSPKADVPAYQVRPSDGARVWSFGF